MAGTLLRFTGAVRGLRISWLTVGIKPSFCLNTCVEPKGPLRTFPCTNPGNAPLACGPARTNRRGSTDGASCSRKCHSLVERTLFEANSGARRAERTSLTSAQTRRLLTPDPCLVNPEATKIALKRAVAGSAKEYFAKTPAEHRK